MNHTRRCCSVCEGTGMEFDHTVCITPGIFTDKRSTIAQRFENAGTGTRCESCLGSGLPFDLRASAPYLTVMRDSASTLAHYYKGRSESWWRAMADLIEYVKDHPDAMLGDTEHTKEAMGNVISYVESILKELSK